MSGHSKWSQIKRQKGAADVKRGAVFSKLANAIILAAKNGGDPNTNFQLKMAVEKAKSENMPKDNIDRAIKRGTGEIGGAKLEEVIYEVIGPESVGIIIEAVTDNRNRTNSEIKNLLGKYSAKLASSGSVLYQFEHLGKLNINLKDKNREELELAIIDAGATDFEEQDDILTVYSDSHDLEAVKRALENQGIEIDEAGLSWESKNLVSVSWENQAKILQLLESLENLDDITVVYTNLNIVSE